jgi:hypothetical protein
MKTITQVRRGISSSPDVFMEYEPEGASPGLDDAVRILWEGSDESEARSLTLSDAEEEDADALVDVPGLVS